MIVWASLIFLASSIPSQYLIKFGLSNYDKVIHVAAFFILGWLSHRACVHQGRVPRIRDYSKLFSFVFVLSYGVVDEVHQAWTPGRSVDMIDILANAAGGGLFLAAVWLAGRLKLGRTGQERA